MNEQKRQPRIKVNWPIKIIIHDMQIEGNVRDINLKGKIDNITEIVLIDKNED